MIDFLLQNNGFITNDKSVKTKLIGEPNNLGKDGDPSGNFGYGGRRHGHEFACALTVMG